MSRLQHCVFFVVALGLCFPFSCLAQGVGVKVGLLQGRAMVLDAGDPGNGTPLVAGGKIMTPAVINVDQGSRLELLLPDGGAFRLAGPAMTRLLDVMAFGDERRIDLEISRGEAWLAIPAINHMRGEVRVTLPAAVLTTKGCQSHIRVGANRRSLVAVYSGVVRILAGWEDTQLAPEDDRLELEAQADKLLRDDSVPEIVKPQPLEPREHSLSAGNQVLIGLGGRVSGLQTFSLQMQHGDVWSIWNYTRDSQQFGF